MSIKLTPFKHDPLCFGSTWTIEDEAKLANQLARIALGQSRHVQQILAGANLAAPPTSASVVAGAVKLLSVSGVDPWHRDGWAFQAMSWIAANVDSPGDLIRPPHMIHAHKGFDGLQIELDKNKVVAAVIFEDKATDNPRDVIREDVWDDFRKLEAGENENVLTAEVVALLQTRPHVDPDTAIETILWKNVRHYRVSITVGDIHSTAEGRMRLFQDYDAVAPGQLNKRRGETFHVPDLRVWMAKLAASAIAAAKATSNV